MRKATVRVTRNFERNLESLREFAATPFDRVLDALFETIIPNLERFPDLGTDFLARQPRSVEGLAPFGKLTTLLDDKTQLREYVAGEWIVLYSRSGRSVYLLAIKHALQLSFDFKEHWK